MSEKKERPDFNNVDEFTEALVLVIESAVDKEQLRMIRDLLATEESGMAAPAVTKEACVCPKCWRVIPDDIEMECADPVNDLYFCPHCLSWLHPADFVFFDDPYGCVYCGELAPLPGGPRCPKNPRGKHKLGKIMVVQS